MLIRDTTQFLHFFCHHLPTSWPFLVFLVNVGSWLATFLSTVSSSIISYVVGSSSLQMPLSLYVIFSREFYFPVRVSSPGPCHLPDDTFGILSLESLLCAHTLSFLVLICSPLEVLVPWALGCSLTSSCLPLFLFNACGPHRKSCDCRLTSILISSLWIGPVTCQPSSVAQFLPFNFSVFSSVVLC